MTEQLEGPKILDPPDICIFQVVTDGDSCGSKETFDAMEIYVNLDRCKHWHYGLSHSFWVIVKKN